MVCLKLYTQKKTEITPTLVLFDDIKTTKPEILFPNLNVTLRLFSTFLASETSEEYSFSVLKIMFYARPCIEIDCWGVECQRWRRNLPKMPIRIVLSITLLWKTLEGKHYKACIKLLETVFSLTFSLYVGTRMLSGGDMTFKTRRAPVVCERSLRLHHVFGWPLTSCKRKMQRTNEYDCPGQTQYLIVVSARGNRVRRRWTWFTEYSRMKTRDHRWSANRSLSIRMVADEIGIDNMIVYGVVVEYLTMWKICAKLAPKVLVDNQKQMWVFALHRLPENKRHPDDSCIPLW